MLSEFSASFAIYIFVLVIVKNDHFQQEQFYQLSVRNRKPKINLNAKRLWLFFFEIIERPKKSITKMSGFGTTRGHPRNKISALHAQKQWTFTIKALLLVEISSTSWLLLVEISRTQHTEILCITKLWISKRNLSCIQRPLETDYTFFS